MQLTTHLQNVVSWKKTKAAKPEKNRFNRNVPTFSVLVVPFVQCAIIYNDNGHGEDH